jgi:TolA-binding protein
MMTRPVVKARALAAASVLCLLTAGASAQPKIDLPFGGMLGTNELGTKLANEVRKLEQSIEIVRTDLFQERRKVQELASELNAEKARSDEDAKKANSALEDLNKLLQAQAQQLQQLRADSERRQQEFAAQMERSISGIATLVQQRLGQADTRVNKLEGDSAELRSDIKLLQTMVTELQGDRRQRDSDQLKLQAEQKTLQNTVTQLESRKTELDDVRKSLQALQEASKLQLDKALEGMVARMAALESTLADTRKDLVEAKRELNLQVNDARRELSTQVTDTKKEVIEIRRSTAPVSVEIDGRSFEALPADRDSYLAAVARVMNAPKASSPREEYEAARTDLQKFLDSVPNPGFRGSAFYWLGMAQSNAGQCREAQVSFDEMRKLVDTARHPRYPSAMLQRATCQMLLKEPQERINRSVKELMDQFPGSPEAESAKALLPPPRRNR